MAAAIVVPTITALLPLVTQYIVPLVERLFGGKKSPTDTQTGQMKQDNAVAILQQIAAAIGASGTNEDYKAIVDTAVAILNANGMLPKPNNLPAPISGTYTFTGTLTAK